MVTHHYNCPNCYSKGSLRIVQAITLPPDSRSDDILVQMVVCDACNFQGGAIYEESRRGAIDAESWVHTGYRINHLQLSVLKALMDGCNDPTNPRCRCQVHSLLGNKDRYGRWRIPAGFSTSQTFSMTLA